MKHHACLSPERSRLGGLRDDIHEKVFTAAFPGGLRSGFRGFISRLFTVSAQQSRNSWQLPSEFWL